MNRRHVVLRDISQAGSRARSEGGARETAAEPPQIRIEAGDMSSREAAEMAHAPEVVSVAPAMPIQLVAPVAMANGSENAGEAVAWGIDAVGARDCPFDGSGVRVAILDTGIDRGHPAFADIDIVEQDFSGSGNGDPNGHGTHCAGTVFGADVEGQRIGLARGIEQALIGKVLGDDGRGSSDMAFSAISWAVDNGAKIISMSLGFDFPGLSKRLIDDGWPADLATSVALEAYRGNLRTFDALMGLIRARAAFGVETLIIAAAGNESRRQINPDYEISASLPAAAEGVIAVGAAEQAAPGLRIADFSNTMPVISAPGVNILSAKTGGGLVALNGTSMACPHVAGVAAMTWQEVSGLPIPATADTVRARLLARANAGIFGPLTDIQDRGVGLVICPPP